MSLSLTEEALVRQLLDQQAAILSLAGNETTITSKLGATKVTLTDLTSAVSVGDSDLLLTRQGVTDKSVTPLLLRNYAQIGAATQKGVQAGDYNTAPATGTANALAGDYTPNVLTLEDGLTLYVRAGAANTTTTPTFSPDGLTAKTIVKGAGAALAVGDIAGAGHWLELTFDSLLDKWVLQNPAKGVSTATTGGHTEFLTPGTSNFTVPAGVTQIHVFGRGAGGGGSGGQDGPTIANSGTAASGGTTSIGSYATLLGGAGGGGTASPVGGASGVVTVSTGVMPLADYRSAAGGAGAAAANGGVGGGFSGGGATARAVGGLPGKFGGGGSGGGYDQDSSGVSGSGGGEGGYFEGLVTVTPGEVISITVGTGGAGSNGGGGSAGGAAETAGAAGVSGRPGGGGGGGNGFVIIEWN